MTDTASQAVTPASIAAIIKGFLQIEPTAMEVLVALYGGSNPVISAAAAIFPTLLPILQQFETILSQLPGNTSEPMMIHPAQLASIQR